MKRLLEGTALLVVLVAAGCHAHGNQELLERELRFQQERIDHLQGHLADYEQQLEFANSENATLRAQAGTGTTTTRSAPRATLGTPDLTPKEQAAPYIGPPQISPPSANIPEGSLPGFGPRTPTGEPATPPLTTPPAIEPPTKPPSVELPPAAPPKIELPPPGAGSNIEPEPLLVPVIVEKITLNPQLTGGYDNDQQPGDDGVVIVVEPRTVEGQLVELSGPLSVVLMDPALGGEAARIARWNLSAEEVAEHVARAKSEGGGALFELPWPAQPPAHRQLQLHVRHTTPDGRKLDAQKPIEIVPAALQARHWTRSAQRRQIPTTPMNGGSGAYQIPSPLPPVDGLDATAPDARISNDDDRAARTPARPGRVWSPYR